MTGSSYRDYVKLRGKIYYYTRRLPSDVAATMDNPPKNGLVKTSLKTKDPAQAFMAAKPVHDEYEKFFAAIRMGHNPDQGEFEKAKNLARAYKLEYMTADNIAKTDMETKLQHVEVAMKTTRGDVKRAALGTVPKPKFTIEQAMEQFFELKSHDNSKKSPKQLKKWENPRRKAIRNFASVVPGVGFFEITRQHVQEFHRWWSDRIINERMTTGTAAKDFIHLRGIFNTIADYDQYSGARPFDGIGFTEDKRRRRESWSVEELKALLDVARPLIDDQEIALLLVMVETGARPIELVGLRKEDILLHNNIPHLAITPYVGHELKTIDSERKIPLVGIGLEVMRQYPNGFDQITDPDKLSNKINKKIRSFTIVRKGVTAYGIRHAFKERMRAAAIPERTQEELMGHVVKSESVIYGRAAPIEQTAPLLEAMALPLP